MGIQNQWVTAKANGDVAEVAIAKHFRSLGWDTFKTIGNAKFDLLLQCDVEVKNDLKARETGNIAIEFEFDGRASGLTDSKARWWVFVVECDKALLIKTSHLRRFVFSNEDWKRTKGGDDNRASLILIPVTKLERYDHTKVIAIEGSYDDGR